jgi:hypothetical protein
MNKNTLIFSLIAFSLVVYLIIALYIFIKRTLILKKKTRTAETNLVKAYDECANAKKKVLAEIAKEFDADTTQKIRDGAIWVGMSDLLLVASLGSAGDLKEFSYNNTFAEKWFYNGYRNLVGKTNYKREVIVRNKVVVEYSDRY